ncbi:DUF3168 domain-containing protein [Clostridium gasigenes]|uniref:DUF3168 domain-containing protein n=1 Tax=Clostridium gasigenes TaxID=94869 RepID=UPI001C0D1D5D|nr:DUF3168 domain-containing protein [Clostridium gasigenes]MBU3102569.1 DUF3168 domain-containing protein [Clostridium gasigenes]
MKSCILKLQEEILKILDNDVEIKRVVNGVYDYVDKNAKLPYIIIGDCETSDLSTEGNDGEEVLQDIEIYSRQRGSEECKQILGLVNKIIFSDLKKIDGFDLNTIKRETSEVFDIEGNLYYGLLQIKLKIGEI